jgi:hypothetical protein
MDLGTKEKSPEAALPAVTSSDKSKVSFPSFAVRDEHADELRQEYDCDVGVEGTATIRFRINGNNRDNYTNSVGIDVLSMDDINIEEGLEDTEEKKEAGEAGEAEPGEKVLGYRRPKSEKEAPKLSAKDLES